MEWMLVIVVITFADAVSHRAVTYESKAACVAAGRDFVARFPGFEWHDPDDGNAILRPVVRSHVRCVPAGDGEVYPSRSASGESREITRAAPAASSGARPRSSAATPMKAVPLARAARASEGWSPKNSTSRAASGAPR